MSDAKANDLVLMKEESNPGEASKEIKPGPQVDLAQPGCSNDNQNNMDVQEAQIAVPEKKIKPKRHIPYSCRPLMLLLHQRLITKKKEDDIILILREKIISILDKELNFDFGVLNYLEIGVYVEIVLNILNKWPKWNEFDVPRGKRNMKMYYLDLKNFLKKRFDAIRPSAEEDINAMTAGMTDEEKNFGFLY